ncbi:ATP-binding protein [Cohnella thailandensis]|uniref:Circadian input-output histidine kinase CikA n=1 Tax=Cohnella thailandensis TaxID=557557 RepID=A0A841SR25_9BACL|nr:ATP-binding protein [Cohnella thailandensis]MBB6632525.1 response regulator [Cohnella thailandensis]MBP1971817.1 signal transduction histidine kinase [Cohnella thailandensis]
MYRAKQALIPVLLILFLAAGCWYLTFSNRMISSDAPEATQGTLDLSGGNRELEGILPLNGQWEFYGNQLLAPEDFASGDSAGGGAPRLTGYADIPSSWKVADEEGKASSYGFGTYRLTIRLPHTDDPRYGIVVNNIKTSHRLFADGVQIGSGGHPGESRSDTEAKNVPYARYYEANGETLQLLVQVANYQYASGGITHPLYFGDQDSVVTYRDNTVALDAITGFIMLLLGAYLLVLYHMRSDNQGALIWFGLTCLANSVYLLTHGDKLLGLIFSDMPYEWFTKLQFLSGILSEYFLIKYTWASFPQIARKRIVRIFEWELAARFVLILVAPTAVYSGMDWVYYLLSFVLMFYSMGIMAASAFRRLEGSLFMAFSALFLFVINLGSFLYNEGIMVAYSLQPISFVGFVLCQLLFLSGRFSNAFTTVAKLSEKLKSLDKLKDEFMANTSHELRTPLHGMINIAQSMMDGATGQLTPHQENNLSLIVNSGRRMSNLVGDILDFSKLKNGEIVLRKGPVNLNALVNVILEMHAALENKKLRLVDWLPDELPAVLGDEDRLTQILYNLIGNAYKFTLEGEIVVTAEAKNGWAAVTVSDTGIGIPADRQEAIFESFEQADSSIARDYGGMGLGLSVTKKLVELHGGALSVRSVLGEGSAFTFTVPIADKQDAETEEGESRPAAYPPSEPSWPYAAVAAAAESVEAREGSSPADRRTILIVDDDAANRQVLLNLLTMENYAVLAARDGEEALRLLENRKEIDLVVLDLMMPRMSGYEVCRAIRARYSLSELPVLILTARSRTEDRLLGFESGANDYLGKPVEAEELKARVRTLLDMKHSAKELVRSELDFLRAQIKPHFLFNALNTVISVSYSNIEQSREMLNHLSLFLRDSFDFDNREELIPFSRELEQTRSYLFIEKIRFGERLKLEFDIEEGLDVPVPPLILQPIVENAVRHGATKRLEGGCVSVTARYAGPGAIVVQVADNGPGMPGPEDAARTEGDSRGTGVGLANIGRRLRSLYGTELEIESARGQGTRVTLRIGSPL